MTRKDFFIRLASLVVFIAIVNFLANKFHWYLSIRYFDMPMHFLGGLWLGLLFLWWFWAQSFSWQIILKIFLGVLIVGIFWEIFELTFVNYLAQYPFNLLDTISDLFFDLAGGSFAMFYYFKRVMPRLSSTV